MFLFCAPQRIAQSRTPTQIIQIAKQLRRRIPQAIQWISTIATIEIQ